MPPEDIESKAKEVSFKSDVWAFGILMFEMCTFQRGYHWITEDDDIVKIIKEGNLPSKDLEKDGVEYDFFVNLIGNCWIINPDERWEMKRISKAFEKSPDDESK